MKIRDTLDYKIANFGAKCALHSAALASLHLSLLPQSSLPQMGRGFLERFYYTVLPQEGLIFGAIAYVDGRPAGFIVNTAYPGSYVSMGARLSPLRFGWELGLAAVSRPGRIVSALRARARMKIAAASARAGRTRPLHAARPGASAGLPKQFAEGLFLGVKPEYTGPKFIRTTGCNVARDLLRRSLDLCAEYRVRELRCGIMRDNMAALLVHFQAGFREDGERLIGATAEHTELSIAIEPAVRAWAAVN